ncbi:hypothetical protein L1987_10896 [Smallanthus sonchifolius]|uniref:Uncharacterized protein n=1 Tax=Smallanthus sonchifolius TaxID=185202 RepID=A0ACB9JCV7_9ASTR|nr:hypothetical protein L1987_10896 [Smallanthus sonchifolius]
MKVGYNEFEFSTLLGLGMYISLSRKRVVIDQSFLPKYFLLLNPIFKCASMVIDSGCGVFNPPNKLQHSRLRTLQKLVAWERVEAPMCSLASIRHQ